MVDEYGYINALSKEEYMGICRIAYVYDFIIRIDNNGCRFATMDGVTREHTNVWLSVRPCGEISRCCCL